MKKILSVYSKSTTSQSEGYKEMADYIYNQMQPIMQITCKIGLFSLEFNLTGDLKDSGIILMDVISLLKTFTSLIDYLLAKLEAEQFEVERKKSSLIIQWDDKKPVIPTVTARDFINAGYLPKGDSFNVMLRDLKIAILKNDYLQCSTEAQLLWIKKNFPL